MKTEIKNLSCTLLLAVALTAVLLHAHGANAAPVALRDPVRLPFSDHDHQDAITR
jgi:hypothetical protein